MDTITMTVGPCLMSIKRHRLPKLKVIVDGKEQLVEQETKAEYDAVPEVDVAAYYDFLEVPVDKFINGPAMRGLRLEAQGVWRAEHPENDLHKWLAAQPQETHNGKPHARVQVDVADLLVERVRTRKPLTPERVANDFSKLDPAGMLAALQALGENNPMFKQALAEFGRR